MASDLASATRDLYELFRDRWDARPATERRGGRPTIVIVPGAFHRSHKHTGADGARVVRLAEERGWPVTRLDVPDFAPAAENAEKLRQTLDGISADRVVLVTLSKGAVDVRDFFSRGLDDGRITGWLNLSGMMTGTPLVHWLRSRPLRYWGVRALLAIRRQSAAALSDLQPVPVTNPGTKAVRIVHVLGFPLPEHLQSEWARRGYRRLAPLGPNDGGGILLTDALTWPGLVCPVWGADHYLQPPSDIAPQLRAALDEAAW